MIQAQQALHEILLIGIDEEPQEVLILKARTIVEKFKANISASHQDVGSTDDKRLHVASELAKLCDAVDIEIDRRVDEDLADSVCDLLEHLSGYLHAEIGDQPELTNDVDANVAGHTASNEVEPRHA
jgi:hypothetical protein